MKSLPRLTQTERKALQKLSMKKYREREGRFIIEGAHLVDESLNSDWEIQALLVTDAFRKKTEWGRIQSRAEEKGIRLLAITEEDLREISDAVTAQGVVGILREKSFTLDDVWNSRREQSLIVVLDGVADPGNVGTIVRTCDWFGVDAIAFNTTTVELYNPKVVRSTMGALFHLPILQSVDAPKTLLEAKKNGFTIFATTLKGGKSLPLKSYPRKSLIVFGSEANGVSDEILREADELITIPKFGKGESLNVGVTCGIVLGMWRLD